MKKILVLFLALTALTAVIAVPVYAAGEGEVKDENLKLKDTVQTPNDLYKIIERVANWIFAIFIVVAIIFILFAAFTYLTSQGGENVNKAHKQLLYAAVAIAVAVLAKGIVAVVRKVVETPVSGA